MSELTAAIEATPLKPPSKRGKLNNPHDDRRNESIKQNLHDELAIKVLNAKYTVKSSEVDKNNPDQMQAFLNDCVNVLIDEIVEGVRAHMDVELVLVKEKMRNDFTGQAYKHGEERTIALEVADSGYAGLQNAYRHLDWVNSQSERMYQFIDDQLPEGLIKGTIRKIVSIPKAVIKSPLTLGKKLIGKGGKHRVG